MNSSSLVADLKLHSLAAVGLKLGADLGFDLYVDHVATRVMEAVRALFGYLRTPPVKALPAALDLAMSQWVEEMYLKVHHRDPEGATDILFEKIDDLLLEGRMSEVDNVIRAIDLRRLDSFLLVGLLSITFAAKDHLRYRPIMVQRIEGHFRKSDPERVEALMSGLR